MNCGLTSLDAYTVLYSYVAYLLPSFMWIEAEEEAEEEKEEEKEQNKEEEDKEEDDKEEEEDDFRPIHFSFKWCRTRLLPRRRIKPR